MKHDSKFSLPNLVTHALSVLVVSILLFHSQIAVADGDDDRSEIWSVARGGQLYDKWWAVIGREKPAKTHAAYPAAGKQKGDATWRCKECHGWDYRGAEGAYAKGSHFSGIKGIRSNVGKDPAAIAKALRAEPHGLTRDMIPDKELNNLALFVSLGQMDMDLYVNRATSKSRGDAERGARYYQTICAVCHGFDGKTINFHDAEKPEYVGTVAQKNPWEFLHKARFGQPGVPMISLITLPLDDLADLLAYAQTLPVK
ncbi:MAG: cytochrome c [Gammaproteobacteria bacterium]|nr:cytochrome c [Gammaproteobacteria bacterium]